MTPDLPYTPSIEELAELYHLLKQNVERIDGHVKQLLAERTHGTLHTPTWRDIDALKKDIAELQKQLAAKRRK